MESPYKLRWDILCARILLWIAGAGRIGDPTPDAHRYLADRYARLAAYHKTRNLFAVKNRLTGFERLRFSKFLRTFWLLLS